MRSLPRLNILDSEGFLKFIDHLVAFEAKHDEVAKPNCVDVLRKFVIASWSRTSVPDDVRNIGNTDGIFSDVQEEWLVAGRILAESSALRP